MDNELENAVTVILPARFHNEQAEKLRIALEELLQQNRNIVLGFNNVVYIDSSGVTTLISLNKAAKARAIRLTLRDMNADVRSFFALTYMDKVFTIE